MTTTRELCRAMATALQVPGVELHAARLVRERRFRPKINRMRRSKAWRDLSDLKRELLDLWTEERNAYAKEVMTDIEAQRKQRKEGR
jgi:hypothetical protein